MCVNVLVCVCMRMFMHVHLCDMCLCASLYVVGQISPE
jgi:hypothetical protein